jgi:hypothetical protein
MNSNELPPEDQPRPTEEEIEDMREDEDNTYEITEEMIEKTDEIAEERGEYVRLKIVGSDDIYKHYTSFHPTVILNIDDHDTHEMLEAEEVASQEL